MNRRLLIVDRYDAPAVDALLAEPARAATTDVLLLGMSQAWLRWRRGVTCLARFDPVPLARAAHEAVEEFVTETVAALPSRLVGGTRISDLFGSPAGNLWWYLDVSERGPYRGPLVQWLYRIAMVRAAIDAGRYDEVAAQIADAPLAEALGTSSSADEQARMRMLPVVEVGVAWVGAASHAAVSAARHDSGHQRAGGAGDAPDRRLAGLRRRGRRPGVIHFLSRRGGRRRFLRRRPTGSFPTLRMRACRGTWRG